MTVNRRKRRPLFYFRLQRSSRARWIVQGRALRGLLKKSSSPECSGIFSQSLALSGTGQKGRQEIKYRLDKPQMSNSKNERYEQKQLHPDGKIP